MTIEQQNEAWQRGYRGLPPLIGIPAGKYIGVLAPRIGMVLLFLGLVLAVLAFIGIALDPAR